VFSLTDRRQNFCRRNLSTSVNSRLRAHKYNNTWIFIWSKLGLGLGLDLGLSLGDCGIGLVIVTALPAVS